jgi:hypothetical protein
MIRALVWKEYREQRAVWLALLGLAAFAAVVVPELLQLGGSSGLSAFDLQLVVAAVALAVFIFALVSGSMLLAGEAEGHTQVFLDIQSGRRFGVWAAKAVAGLVFTLLLALATASLAVALELTGPGWSPRAWFVVLTLAAVDVYAWALLGSALTPGVLRACALTTLLYVVGLFFTALFGATLGAAMGGRSGGTAMLIVRTVLDLGAVELSAFIFCREDLSRWRQAVPGPRRAAPARAAGVRGAVSAAFGPLVELRRVFWLARRQGWAVALLLAAFSLLMVPVILAEPLIAWALVTLFLGLGAGVAAFAAEQAGGSQRFLGDQRLPLGRVWLFKVGLWAAVALGCLGLCFLVTTITLVASSGSGDRSILMLSRHYVRYFSSGEVFLFLGLWAVYGFAVGQFFTMIFRKPVVAVVVATVLGGLSALAWLPALLCGGIHSWLVFVPPLLLLAASRGTVKAWANDRLTTWRPALVLTAAGLLALLWTAGAQVYRGFELPDPGEPFDVEAYLASLPSFDEDEAGRLIRQAASSLRRHKASVTEQLGRPTKRVSPPTGPALGGAPGLYAGPPPSSSWGPDSAAAAGPDPDTPLAIPGGAATAATFTLTGPPVEPESTFSDQVVAVIEHGWPAAGAPELEQFLDRVFAGDWVKDLRAAAALPPGIVEDPRRMMPFIRLENYSDISDARSLLKARALQLRAKGDHAGALEQYALLLSLARNCENHSVAAYYFIGLATERLALDGLTSWLGGLPKDPAFVRRALAELDRHERERPRPEYVQAEYLVMRDLIASPILMTRRLEVARLDERRHQSPEDALAATMIQATGWSATLPWERERARRLFHALVAGRLRLARLGPREAEAQTKARDAALAARFPPGAARWGPIDYRSILLDWLPPGPEDGTQLRAEQLGEQVLNSWLMTYLQYLPGQTWRVEPAAVAHLRATRIAAGAVLYQMEHGRMPATLDELVPAYLPAVPLDPFDGQPFRYRQSLGGETVYLGRLAIQPGLLQAGSWSLAKPSSYADLARGQGVIWSVGPDGEDNQGETDGWSHLNSLRAYRAFAADGTDLLFLVPVWRDRR